MTLADSLSLIKRAAESLDAAPSVIEIFRYLSQGDPYDAMFFSSLADPQWIALLKEGGHFNQLPSPKIDRDGNTRYPRSLPLFGLAKVAKAAPLQTIEILEALPEYHNPQIDDQIMRCVAQIEDPNLFSRCLPILDSLFQKTENHDWIWIDNILSNWLNSGKKVEAIQLLNLYLLSQIREQKDRHDAGTGWRIIEIDRDIIEPLAASNPKDLAVTFFRALVYWKDQQKAEAANDDSEVVEQPEPSTFWLEDFHQRRSRVHELEEILATRLFEIGSVILTIGTGALISDFDQLLRSDPWELFSRMRWQLYADHPEKTCAWAHQDVMARIPLLSHYLGSHGFEMAQMLEAHSLVHGLNFLSPDEVDLFYNSVMAGPVDPDGSVITDERHVLRFRRRQLHPIRKLLKGVALSTYSMLATAGPELSAKNYKPFSSGGEARSIEQVAPKIAEDMASMSDLDLWSLLNTWKPSSNRYDSEQWWIEESVSALGPKFAELLESQPQRFQATNKWWRNLTRPSVLYKPLERASAKIAKDSKEEASPPTENDWRNWFGLSGWLADEAERPLQLGAIGSEGSEDDDWNWPGIIAVKFLASAMDARFPVPEDLKPEIGENLRKFVLKHDSRLASKEGPWMDDWLTTAINSVRGTAFEDLLQLALIQKRESGEPEDWIFQVIRTALSDANQSPAVFAILGARLNLALHLYGEQFKQEPDLLLPKENSNYRNAFILSQIRYGNPLGRLLEILPYYPVAALRCLAALNSQENSDREQRGDFGSRLGTHLCFYFWNNAYADDLRGRALVDAYFDTAKPSHRQRAIADIAQIFSETSEDSEGAPLLARVRDLWDRRYSVIEVRHAMGIYTSDDLHGELSAFLKWLGSECHPFEWRRDRVLKAISLLEKSPQAAFTMRTLEKLSQRPDRIGAVTEILEALLSKESEMVSWAYQDDEMKPILLRGLGSNDEEVVERTRRIQDILLRHRLFDYLDLG